MDCSTPGFPVLLYLPEFAQTHVHWISDAIQPSHSLLPALSLSRHQGLFQWVSSSHQVAKVLVEMTEWYGWNGLIAKMLTENTIVLALTSAHVLCLFFFPLKEITFSCLHIPFCIFSLPATCVCVCLVAQSYPTLWNLMDCSPPGCSVHWDSPGKNTGVGCHALLQGISQPRDRTQVSCIAGKFFTIWATREALRLHERTHPPSSFILFPRIVCISSKGSIYHMPVTHPPIFVFNTNEHSPPSITISRSDYSISHHCLIYQ